MKSSTSSSAKLIVMRQWKTREKLARRFWGDPVVSGLWLRKLGNFALDPALMRHRGM